MTKSVWEQQQNNGRRQISVILTAVEKAKEGNLVFIETLIKGLQRVFMSLMARHLNKKVNTLKNSKCWKKIKCYISINICFENFIMSLFFLEVIAGWITEYLKLRGVHNKVHNSPLLAGLPKVKSYDQKHHSDTPWTLPGLVLWPLTYLESLFQWSITLSVKKLFQKLNLSCLTQLHFFSLFPTTGHQTEENSNFPSIAPLEVVVDCDGVTPQPPLL